MDKELEKKAKEAMEFIRLSGIEDIENVDFDRMDPIAKMMIVALMHEEQKIKDYIDCIPQKIAERYCSDFIPYEKIGAMPAITLLRLAFKPKANSDIITMGSGTSFVFKTPKCKQPLNYIPIFGTTLVPYSDVCVLTPGKMTNKDGVFDIGTSPQKLNKVWIGIVSENEIESLHGLSLLIKGTNNIYPQHIYVISENRNGANTEIEFSTMREMENIEMLEPFDAQQASGQFFSFVNKWKECLLNMDNSYIIHITDKICDRDVFKPYNYPKIFQQWLEDESLDRFKEKTIWIELDFPEEYTITDDFEVCLNVVPVVNVDVNNVTLTQSSPIAKLQKQENSFFLSVLETSTASHKQGFGMTSDDFLVRDFDASCYNNGDLYRDVRNLYNRFLDDYYAFVEYNGIKDGEILKRLRETINRLGKSVGEQNRKFKFDSGTYVMRNIHQEALASTMRVSYTTTLGELGNTPVKGDVMENRKLPAINQKVEVVVSATGGADKASPDTRYELLRYYALTNDRLYTRMDIDAFLRKEILLAFGKEESRRIFIHINIEGTGGPHFLRRGMYIDIDFKDKKNYDEACRLNFDLLMQQRIANLSCISMPIIVTLKDLEG